MKEGKDFHLLSLIFYLSSEVSMQKRIVLIIIGCLVLTCGSLSQSQEVLPSKIDQAIERGVTWLKDRQIKKGSDKGSWGGGKNPLYGGGTGPSYEPKIGITAFSLYALLACEVPPDDPVIKGGFAYVQNETAKGNPQTYERAAILMALEALADAKYKKAHPKKKGKGKRRRKKRGPMLKHLSKPEQGLAQAQVQWLSSAQTSYDVPDEEAEYATKTKQGGWRYAGPDVQIGKRIFRGHGNPGGVNEDISATQFALLGLKAAVRLGLKVDKEVFLKALRYNLQAQQKDGPVVRFGSGKKSGVKDSGDESTQAIRKTRARGWAYHKAPPKKKEAQITGSMTTAGTCSLIICKSEVMGTKLLRKELSSKLDQGIFDGIAWIIKNYTVDNNPNGFRGHYYYLYGLERVGMLGGFTWLGDHNWYFDGAKVLLRQQLKDGHWYTGSEIKPCDVIETDYALLFLKKATKPVMGVTTD